MNFNFDSSSNLFVTPIDLFYLKKVLISINDFYQSSRNIANVSRPKLNLTLNTKKLKAFFMTQTAIQRNYYLDLKINKSFLYAPYLPQNTTLF